MRTSLQLALISRPVKTDMRVPRIYLSHLSPGVTRIELDERATRYTKRALRLKPGCAIQVFNGKGNAFNAILGQGNSEIVMQKELVIEKPPPVEIFLLQGISKSERMDIAIQKTTELGVTGIYPVFTEHCVVTMDAGRAMRRLERWTDIAINACEQCG